MKTSELTGYALDWAVTRIKHPEYPKYVTIEYSSEWEYGGPIIEREGIALIPGWTAERPGFSADGPTPLIAAMRCYVSSKLGDTVDIPEELK
jgi:hypothetical protein